MRRKHSLIAAALLLVIVLPASRALSREIGRDIEFPKNYDPRKAEAILSIVKDEQFKFRGGIVSYWPPDWGTRLSFTGDTESLNRFLQKIRDLRGISLRVILYQGRNDEYRRDSEWQLDFSHARPEQLAVYINVSSGGLDLNQLSLPDWPARK